MEHKAISQQLLIEHEMITHLETALRNILQWTSHGQDLSRKLSSLRFMTESFERHLERLMTLEEHDGYMEVVVESQPQLKAQVDTLRSDHDLFRLTLRRITARLDRLSGEDKFRIEQVSDELLLLLETLDIHSRKEVDLLQESILRDEGGEE
jgi:hypothetical protein